MGEIADMMIEGDLCAGCGGYLPGEGSGFPRYCRDCRSGRKQQPAQFAEPKNHTKIACKVCGRHVKKVGLADHVRDKHGSAVTQGVNDGQ